MKCKAAVAYKHRLDSLFEQVKDVAAFTDDPEILAHWAKYLCVLASGFVEVSLCEICSDYVCNKAEPRIARLVKKHLKDVKNPKPKRISQVVGWFDPDWEREVDAFFEDDHRRAAIISIMENRHLIAHGESSNITYHRIHDWYNAAVEVVDFLDTLIGC